MSAEIWTFPIRTVTPAFIAGANPNESAELRVPSIRGALRAWYRLLVGPEVAAGLRQADCPRESELFGGVGPKEGQGKVLFSLDRVAPVGDMPWNNAALRREQPGLAYLGFSLDMRPNTRTALPPGTEFGLRLLLPRGLKDDEARLLLGTLWFWLTLGGIGARSRRGFGSLRLSAPPTFTNLYQQPLPNRSWPAPVEGADLSSLGRALAKGLWATNDHARKLAPLPSPSPADARLDANVGPAYHLRIDERNPNNPERSRIVLWGGPQRLGWATASAALDAIGQAFSAFRKESGRDGLPRGALSMLTARERLPRAPGRAAFGLPLALRPVGRAGAGFELLPYVPNRPGRGGQGARGEQTGGRAPSPLLFRVCPMGARYVVVLTLLSGPWPGRDVDLRERRETRGFVPKDPQNTLPNQFLDGLTTRTEV